MRSLSLLVVRGGRAAAFILLLLGMALPLARAGDLDLRGWLERPGTRLVAVEFYATWCGPCMKAVPRWKELHEKYRSKGLRLIVVNTYDPEGACVSPGWNPDQVVCDQEGVLADGFGLDGKLPAAFLWSWQGNLLVSKGHVEQVGSAIERYMRENPRVLVDARGASGKPDARLRGLVRSELSRVGKLTVVATERERRAMRRIVKRNMSSQHYDERQQCELGHEVPPNSQLKVALTGSASRRRLSLSLFSMTSGCLMAGTGVPWNPRRAEAVAAEAVDRLLSKLKVGLQMPGTAARRPVKTKFTDQDIGGKTGGEWKPGGADEVIVEFSSDPAGAVVLLDADLVCPKTPCSRSVPRGRHLVSMQAERHEKKQERLNLAEGAKIDWKLVPNFGWLTVHTKPRGMKITVNDREAGQSPLDRIEEAPGIYKVLAGSECHYQAGKKVRIERGLEKVVDLEMNEKQGALRVKAKDRKGNDIIADVYVDGRKLGRTPGTYKVSVCAKEIEVKSEKKGSVKKRLEIHERKVTRVDVVLKEGFAGMVRIPAGEFWMGCNTQVDTQCQSDEKPGRKVYLDEYSIDGTEVTVGQYRRCVSAGRCSERGLNMPFYNGKEQPKYAKYCNWGKSGRGSHPINCLDWNQAKAYCEWAGKRLPTEAEWEKAARGADGRKYPWGNAEANCSYAVMDDGKTTGSAGTETDGCGEDRTWPVCSKKAGNSPYGLCDMAGNVWEWVADWYGKSYYSSAGRRNPSGPGSGKYRVLRGGSWSNNQDFMRSSNRHGNDPSSRARPIGFRCVGSPAR